jgi:hypothetical protein
MLHLDMAIGRALSVAVADASATAILLSSVRFRILSRSA